MTGSGNDKSSGDCVSSWLHIYENRYPAKTTTPSSTVTVNPFVVSSSVKVMVRVALIEKAECRKFFLNW